MTTSPSLDHLILFLPPLPNTRTPLIPSPLGDSFTLTPGGVHSPPITANTLIILEDGCYIELICFLPDFPSFSSTVKEHWWGPDPNRKGWTDWCLTNAKSAEENYEGIGESHQKPIAGSRKRPDGEVVQWSVTFPRRGKGGQKDRGKVPFWCHDVTDRSLRVPINEEKTKHPCGAVGVRELTVIVRDRNEFDALAETYRKVFGVDGAKQDGKITFEIRRVIEVQGLSEGPRIVLRLPKDAIEQEKVHERGFWYGDVVLAAHASDEHPAGERIKIDRNGDDSVEGLWVEYA